MNIIVEGCDCSGKSSICKELMKRNSNLKYNHCSNPKDYEDGKKQYEQLIDVLNKSNNLIYDGIFIKKDQIQEIQTKYFEEFQKSNIKDKYIIDSSYKSVSQIVDLIESILLIKQY